MKKESKGMKENVVKVIDGDKDETGLYRFNREFIEEFILKDRDILNANIYAHRILANIGFSLRQEQTQIKNEDYQYKLDLFDEEFLSRDNSGILFRMNSIEICKGGNYGALQKALNFLESYKKDWYESINSKGETIKTLSGLVSNAVINRQTGNFQFFVSFYWLRQILHLADYNDTYYQLVQNVSSNKHMVFWYWLRNLRDEGTQVNYQTLNRRFQLNYKNARDLCKGFLYPIKRVFDKYAHYSFNFNYSGDKISIVRYLRTPEDLSKTYNLEASTKTKINKQYKVSYLRKRHKLTKEEIAKIEVFYDNSNYDFNSSYAYFVDSIRQERTKDNPVKATDFTNQAFLDKFQESIIAVYRQTPSGKHRPNSYFKII